MRICIGDIVTLKISDVAAYGCWGMRGKQTGFVHLVEWSWDRPVPTNQEPHIGDEILVKVHRLTNCPYDQLLADVTFDGKFKVDFEASIRMLHPEDNPWYDPSAYQIGEIFVGKVTEVHSFGCWVRHPRGADGCLAIDGVAHGLVVGQPTTVKVVGVNLPSESLRVVLFTHDERPQPVRRTARQPRSHDCGEPSVSA